MSGATDDFLEMLALLVQATRGEARMVFSKAGDWGIDVYVGSLSGQVSIWQAKYFLRGVTRVQIEQIRHSFQSAVENAARNGYSINKWILCASMDARTSQWWHEWQLRQSRETGISIELWDETRLRALLLSPEASSVRRHYYTKEADRATVEVQQALFDVWSAVENLAGRPRGQVYTERLARLTGVDHAEIDFSKRIRNDLGHRGHGNVGDVDAIRALKTARCMLVKLSSQAAPVPSTV
jgi:hypothetical protein